MPAGIHLDGTEAAVVSVSTLASVSSSALTSVYQCFTLDDGTSALFGDCIDSVVAIALAEAGVRLVDYDAADPDVVAVGSAVATVVAKRSVHGLLAAFPPQPVIETSAPARALFVAHTERAATRLLERLVLLHRHDALVSRLADTSTGGHRTTVRLAHPPWWLVSRVVDGDEEDVSLLQAPDALSLSSSSLMAPTSSTMASRSSPTPKNTEGLEGRLFVACGLRHALASHLEKALHARGELGLLWGDGTFERIAAPLAELPILSTLQPVLPPTTTVSTSVLPPEQGFTVQLRLAPTGDTSDEPELFIIESRQLAALSTFAEAAHPDELSRVVLGRLGDVAGRPRYVVRELVRGAEPRLGARLQSLLQCPGYVRVPGVEGLYVPPGRRLSPAVRDKDLRALLGLAADAEGAGDADAAAAAVIIDEDSDGLTLTSLSRLDDRPLRELSSYRLTDRRTTYDRLFEDAVLSFPEVRLPRVARASSKAAPKIEVKPQVQPKVKTPPVRVMPTPSASVAGAAAEDVVREALVVEEQHLQAEVMDDLENASTWSRLAVVKAALRRDDATETASAAAFLARVGDDVVLDPALLDQLTPPGPTLLELVVADQPTHAQALRLCFEVLRLLQAPIARSEVRLKDDILQQATRLLLQETMPAPLRLRWVTLHQIARHLDDPIGLTRAKEALLGVLNTRGQSEALDLPRFVRTALAFSGLEGEAHASEAGRSRQEQLVLLERTLHLLVPEPLEVSDGRGALLKAIWATGFAKLGGQAKYIVAAIDVELPLHDEPVQALLRLYQAKASFAASRGAGDGAQAWRDEVLRTMASVERPEDRRVAEWLMKRSRWLRHQDVVAAPTGLRPSLRAIVGAAVAAGAANTDVAGVMGDVRAVKGAYDFEVAAAFDELLQLALRTGKDDVIEAAALEARTVAPTIRILSHRARLLGATVRAAAAINATSVIEDCLDDVAAIANDTSVPSVNDLLSAIRPALSALRKVGASDAARRFLLAFKPLTSTLPKETGPLSAALAEGFLQLGDHESAHAMLELALNRIWSPNTPHIDRYEAAAAVVSAVVHWPADYRYRLVERFVEQLTIFTDTFTTGRYFPTHQLLLAEHLIDTLVDDTTARSDHVQRWLDDDEARVRRRIIADWRGMTKAV
jgi:hypothetical protein